MTEQRKQKGLRREGGLQTSAPSPLLMLNRWRYYKTTPALASGVQFARLRWSIGPWTSVSVNVTVIEPLPCTAPEPEASGIWRTSSGLAGR